jgi:hypothetical protein
MRESLRTYKHSGKNRWMDKQHGKVSDSITSSLAETETNRNNKSYNLAARVLGAIQNKACQTKCIDLFGSETFW